MIQNLSLWQFGGFAFTSLLGTLLHFLYDWTNKSVWIAPFSGVNESTWEHMKLLFFPLFLFALFQAPFFKEYENYWCIKLRSTIIGIALIPVLFYTYNGAFGHSPDWLNIAIFFVTAAIVFLSETKQFKKGSAPCKRPWLACLVICLIGGLFIVFTYFPPQLPLFRDPLTGSFGR
ncbi:MAG: hypothetical protein IJP27_08385 [Clostridia bacterium]|nr:hypothetical protein [Clostridia bacterium]